MDFSINDKRRGYRRPGCKPCWTIAVQARKARKEANNPEAKQIRLKYHRDYYHESSVEGKKKWRAAAKKTYHDLRNEIITGFGAACAQCGIDDVDVLQIDHIFGGGGRRRRELGTNKEYRIIRDRMNNKKDFQIFRDIQLLCANCHHKKTTRR